MYFEKAFGGGADMRLRMQAAHDLAKCAKANSRSPCAALRGRHDVSHFGAAVVKGIADRAAIGARTLIAARQGFTDVDKDRVAVTGTATYTFMLASRRDDTCAWLHLHLPPDRPPP